MGLNENSLREGQTSGAFWGLLYAYDLIGEFRKWLTHMRREVWLYRGNLQLERLITHISREVCDNPMPTEKIPAVNPHAQGIAV